MSCDVLSDVSALSFKDADHRRAAEDAEMNQEKM